MLFSRAIALGVASVLTVAIGASPVVAATESFELNAILPITGPAAFVGSSIGKGLKVAEDYVNATGGIQGRPLKINLLDDQANPQVALQLANQLIANKVPVFIAGLTASCGAISPLIAKSGPLTYCFTPFGEAPPGSFVFLGGPSAFDAACAVLRYFRERGLTRFAMLNATDGSGQVLDAAFEEAFRLPENHALVLVAHQHFAVTDTSVSAEVSAIKAATPQVVISWVTGTPFGTLAHGMHDVGLDVPVVTNGANMLTSFLSQLGPNLPTELDFAAYPSYPQGGVSSKRILAEQRAQANAFKASGVRLDGTVVGAWDLTMVIVNALRHLPRDATAEQVRAYIAATKDFAATNGIYNFITFPQRGVGRDGNAIARYDAATNDFVKVSKPGGALR